MKFTGERFVPERVPEQMILEHLHRYHLAARLAAGREVLDAACGAGYGSAILAAQAVRVTGLDLSAETVAYASERYQSVTNVQYVQGSIAELPFADASFDMVVSFETIEHVPEELQYRFRSEIRRVLRPGGLLVMSSPDKHTYSELLHFDNEFHVREMYAPEFASFLQEVFPYTAFYRQGVNDFYLSAVRSLEPGNHQAEVSEFEYDEDKELYVLAVASDRPLAVLPDLTSFMSRKKELVPRLYLDFGEGFSEQAIVYGRLEEQEQEGCLRVTFLLAEYPGIQGMRFDPEDGAGARVQLLEVLANGKPVSYTASEEAVDKGPEGFVFYTPDPFFLLQGDFTACQQLTVTYRCTVFTQQEVYEGGLVPLREARDHALIETANCQAELDELALEIRRMRNTRGWRMLEVLRAIYHRVLPPDSLRFRVVRFLYRLLRRLSVYRVFRGLECLFTQGPAVFWKRLRSSLRPQLGVSPAVDQTRYDIWIAENEPKPEELEAQCQQMFSYRPLISVVVPAYNTPEVFLRELVGSLLAQTYSNWELCLADGGSSNAEATKEILESYGDARLRCELIGENRRIAGNTNAALAMAQGEFIAFVDHDDVLAPFAFYEVVAVLQAGRADYIYSDEDKLGPNGRRSEPHFKPDFAIDTLRSYNYISHLSVVRRTLMDKIGGLSDALDGSQDYDVTLRAIEQTEHIVHIPKVLYHWRVHEGSVSLNQNSKSYAFEAGRQAIENHLQRLQVPAKVVQGNFLGSYRVLYELPEPRPLVSIIIPNMEHEAELRRTMDSILKLSTYPNYEVVIVENNSKSAEIFDYYKELAEDRRIKVVRWQGQGFNFSALVNFGAEHTQGEYMLLLNNDVEVITPEWLENMVMFCQREDVGAVGARLYYPDDTIQHAGVFLHPKVAAAHSYLHQSRFSPGYFGRLQVAHDVSAVTGACLMTKRCLFDAVGGLDDKELTVDYNDIDFCLKLRQLGKLVVFNPWVELYHYESVSRGGWDNPDNKKRWAHEREDFLYRWASFIGERDPYFNYFLIDD